MKKIKNILLFFLGGILCLSLCACSNSSNQNNNTKKIIHFNNLVNQSDLEELYNLFTNNGISNENAQKVMNSIYDYNQTIGNELLYSDGSIDLSNPILPYDDLQIDEKWAKENDLFIGYNCRLTAFELMKDFISISDVTNSNPSALFMDEDALNYSQDNYFSSEDFEKFKAFYSTINTTSSTDVQEQYAIQQEYWNSIGVEFSNNEQISLISVYIHNHFSEDENELIVGHTGVLIQDHEGYVFFEKLSFQLPYQMIRLNSKEELKEYLMAIYDTDTTNESAKPFILENNHPL